MRDLVSLIREIPTDGRQDYDVLGFVYEYLISNFAANAGKKAGEFYTPHQVSVMMSDIIAHHLRDNDEIRIYDPTSGSGSLLINIGKSVARHISDKNNIKYYAQELKQNTFNLTRMNLIMRGISPSNIECRNGDTLAMDWPMFDESDPQGTYDPLYVDAVVSNPPYSQEWDPTDQENDPRYAPFGVAPKGCADYAFLLHDLYHVKPSGIMTIVLPHGVLYRGGSEYQIRKQLVEFNHIDAIIGLPEKVFFGTGISTIVMVLKRMTRVDDRILFVDASSGYEKDGKNNRLRTCDIKKIVDAVTNRTETPDFARLVSRDIIRQNDYNLNISRYVDSSPKAEKYDIYATMFGGIPAAELASLNYFWQAFPSLKQQLFSINDEGYSHIAIENVQQTIGENADVKHFTQQYNNAFDSFASFIETTLIEPMMSLNIQKTQTTISDDLFQRIEKFPLVDKYQTFQFFSYDWDKIAADLEILQTEGFQAVKQVDPRMVEKNKEEVQDGWMGHVLPFELVQERLLQDDVQVIHNLEQRMEELTSRFNEIIDSLTPEEKDKPILSDDNSHFVATEVKKELKRILAKISTPEIEILRTFPSKKSEKEQFIAVQPELAWDAVEPDKSGNYGKTQINALIRYYQENFAFGEDSLEAKVKVVAAMLDEEKKLGVDTAEKRRELVDKTIVTIQSLDDKTAIELLRCKWISPLVTSLQRMPGEVITVLADKVQHLVAKYAITYQDIAQRISSAESQLFSLIGELEGNKADNMGLEEFKKTLNEK